ncbi:PAS domain S-box-containing protein [Terriglobus roseus]|uniref:histidine kinase n=2 Tax=Terriglobus roseus TaxID=392734 RepID=A0A1G7QRS1_9BACT|nr:PAS domain S-box-containing protein [Terriglobus roseus]
MKDMPKHSPSMPLAIDTDDCANEPIRIPGSIQPHGFLLGLDEDQEHIVVASENAADSLRTPFKLILNASIELLFDRELLSAIRQQKCAVEPEGMVTYVGSFRVRDELYAVITHCVEGKRILEFERQDRLVSSEMMNSIITNFVGTLSKLETQQELCDAITAQVAQLTGYDRILLYSFDEEGHGTVLSEQNNGRLPSYLDLRFPAADIPRQARELYLQNTVRIIPDAYATPSPLRAVSEVAPHILDLSLAVLRSVSPVHIQYMKNMGTVSSMSISIVSEGRLWGLISGHHSERRSVPYLVRSACDMLSKLVGTQLTTFRTRARLNTLTGFHTVQRQLLTDIAAQYDYLDVLSTQMESLQQITAAAGVALSIDGEIHAAGTVPADADIHRITHWLDRHAKNEIYVTRELSKDLPWAVDLADTASGLMAIRISDVRQRYILWFRPQVVRTVTWAGEPAKPTGPEHLHPRKSFEKWREIFHGQSIVWTEAEIESAREFLAAITTISLRRAEEEAELSNARFEQLTHALPEKIFTADDSGRLLYVNGRWLEQGLGEQGIWYEDGRLDAEDQARIEKAWIKAVRTGEPFEEEARLFSGEPRTLRWNLVRVVPFRRKSGERAGWIGSMIDLTERREREAALRMTEKLALTGRMTSVIAHEINNPLESITNLLFLVRHDLPPNAQSQQYLAQAESELERISGITRQTLRWSRENSLGAESFTAGGLFADVLRLFQGKILNRNVTATIRDGHDVSVCGIVGQIRQVIANLVSNAVDAARLGGNVWLEARPTSNGGAELIVGDDGVGMTEEQQRQLFEPFFSTKGDLGNGLGLYISEEIVERHGGAIRCTSAPGEGSVFCVSLPPAPTAATANRASAGA